MDRGKAIFIIAVVAAAAIAASQGGLEGSSKWTSFSPFSISSSSGGEISDDPRDIEKEVEDIKKDIEKNQAALDASPLSKTVSLSISSAGSSKPDQEYVTITVSSRHVGKVLLTGMTLKSMISGKGTTIGEGVSLPFAGVINDDAPIFLSPGEKAVIITGRSPTGYSFKLNACTGYFAQFQSFSPSLPRQCPDPLDEAEEFMGSLTDSCYDYLNGLSRCTMPLQNIPVAYLDSSCHSFVTNKLNYKTCSEVHKDDKDFYKKEWRVYLGQSQELWKPRREVIKLLDQSGKVVDSVTY